MVEDAHWADEATLDLLVFLGRRLERHPALLMVTYRDDEVGADHPLRGSRRPAPGVVRRLRPQPLSEAAVAELARRAGRPAAGLRELTGGNPLLVTEVLAAGDAGVPLTVRDLVLARLAGLPADAQEVVRLVAVVPTRAELWLLEPALGPAPSAVEACVAGRAAGRRGRGGRVPPRAAPAGGGGLAVDPGPPGAEPAGPGGAGRRPRPGVDLARLVHHAREAGDIEAVLRYAPEAARQAAAVAAHREAVGHYRAVLAHAERLPAPVRAELLEGYSVEAYLSGLSAEAVSARQAAAGASGRRPATRSGSARACAGCRACTGGTATGGRRRRPRPGPSPCSSPAEPGHQLAMAYSNQAQLDMLAHRTEAAMAGPGGRSSWPGGWTTRRPSPTP